MSKSSIDRSKILPDHGLAAFSVTLANELLDLLDCFVARQHATECEETRLHDRVDAVAELALSRDAGGVDGEDLQPFIDDHLLHRGRQVLPNVFIWTIDQER